MLLCRNEQKEAMHFPNALLQNGWDFSTENLLEKLITLINCGQSDR